MTINLKIERDEADEILNVLQTMRILALDHGMKDDAKTLSRLFNRIENEFEKTDHAAWTAAQ